MEYLEVKRKVGDLVAAMDHPLLQHEHRDEFIEDLVEDFYYECKANQSLYGADFDWEKYVEFYCTVDRFVKNAQAYLEMREKEGE